MPKGYIFFDIGSTLMDGPDISPASRFAKELNLSDAQKETINDFLFTEEIMHPDLLVSRFKKHLPKISESSDDIIRKIWHAQSKDGFIIDGAIEAIKHVSDKGYKTGIISNIWHPYYMCFKNLFSDIFDIFDEKILSYEVGHKKPSTDIFREALGRIGCWNKKDGFINPGISAIVGDSYYHDIAPAIKIGMKTIWVMKEKEREAQFLEKVQMGTLSPPDFIVSDIKSLKSIEL
ncbi:MAG: HAD family hydrolase [Candidatus Eremiobacteraeota bacterium]|nr:HAD family hydrolase [Candidatus Eremiobacteraeota bacterium]